MKTIMRFVYKYSGLKAVVESIEGGLLRYRLRLNIVPVSYKLFLVALGGSIGASGMFIQYNYPALLQSNTITIENKLVRPVEAKELTIEEKIAKAFPENPEVMIAIAKAESGLDKMAVNINTNGSRDIGLFQINSIHGEDDLEMMDVDNNIRIARSIYDKQGVTAWSTFKNGSYKKFLN